MSGSRPFSPTAPPSISPLFPTLSSLSISSIPVTGGFSAHSDWFIFLLRSLKCAHPATSWVSPVAWAAYAGRRGNGPHPWVLPKANLPVPKLPEGLRGLNPPGNGMGDHPSQAPVLLKLCISSWVLLYLRSSVDILYLHYCSVQNIFLYPVRYFFFDPCVI